ncbi:hypothetical protein [Natrinema altunense]|nr:hypothetical protein [Natrinema altunense]
MKRAAVWIGIAIVVLCARFLQRVLGVGWLTPHDQFPLEGGTVGY